MMRPFWRRVPIVGGVVLSLVIVVLVAFNTYAILSEDDGEPETHLAQPTDAATPDVPRYTDEEVIAKIRDYQFAVTYDDGTEELWTVTNMSATVASIEGMRCVAMGPLAYEMMRELDMVFCVKVEESATYEGNGRWTVVLTFGTTTNQPVQSRSDARFSFREDTGEIIPLNVDAQNLMGRGQ
jgi:hypothetical protein